MSLPPLASSKNLSRLLAPNESIIYTGKLHPFHGLAWLGGAALFAGLACCLYVLWGFSVYGLIITAGCLVACMFCVLAYLLPFRNTQILVTTHRLLLRHGRFSVHTDEIDASHIDHYQLHQTPFSMFFHYGTFILNLNAGRNIYYLTLHHVWHPMTLLEALTTLNPLFQQK